MHVQRNACVAVYLFGHIYADPALSIIYVCILAADVGGRCGPRSNLSSNQN